MSYIIQWRLSAQRDLELLQPDMQQRILVHIEALARHPRPTSSKALQGTLKGLRRLRVGDYRIAYIVKDDEKFIGIIAVGHRSKFYKNLER